jgi:hypothetical protein
MSDWNNVEIKIKPDKNAILRAQLQNDYKDDIERSSIDVMLQSAFMQLGSENAYNSLTDKRYGPLSTNNEGLTEFEKTFVETIVNNESKISLTYQIVDENQKLVGYNYDYETVKQQVLDALKNGHNVIIGITEVDDSMRIIGGHEITVVGTKKGQKDDLEFICNDTDDNKATPIVIRAKDLIPKIHHAGIPTKLVNMPPQEDLGYQILQEYNKIRTEQPAQSPVVTI